MISYSPYILCFEDFDYDEPIDLNEATQDTIKKLQGKKQHFAGRINVLKRKQKECMDVSKKLKAREGNTKNKLTQKIYQARIQEESMRQEQYKTRIQAVQQAAKILDQKLLIANLRLRSQTAKKAK